MNYKTTLVIVLLAAAVAAVLFLDTKRHPEPTPSERSGESSDSGKSGTPLFTLDTLSTQSVNTLAIERAGTTVRLAKSGVDWRQVAPVTFALDSWTVQQILDAAANLRYTTRITPRKSGGSSDTPSLEDLGLDKPAATLTIESAEHKGSNHTLKLGKTAIGGKAYVMLDGESDVFVVADALHKLVVDQTASEWRKRSLEAPGEGQATKLEITTGGKTIAAVKSDLTWSFAAPETGRVDADAVRAVLSGISSAYVEKFIADNPADLSLYGLDKPATTVVVTAPTPTSENASTQPAASQPAPKIKMFRIGAPVDAEKSSYFATWSDASDSQTVVFTVTRSTIEKFSKSANDLRDPRLTVLKASDVREVTLERAAGAVRMVKGPEGWSFGTTGGKPIEFKLDQDAAGKLVESIMQARATSFTTAAPGGSPEATVTLAAIARPDPDVLRVYPGTDAKTRTVFRNNESVGAVIPAEKLIGVSAPVITLRDRHVWELPTKRIAAITIERADGPSYKLERSVTIAETAKGDTQPAEPDVKAGPWKLVGFDKYESAAVESLLSLVSNLRAESWPSSGEKTGAGAVKVTIQVTGDQARTLTIDPSTKLALASGIDAPFSVSQRAVETVTQEFRDRTAIKYAPAQLTRLVVTDLGKAPASFTLEKDSSGRYTSPDIEKLNQATAAAVFDAVGALRVERYVAAKPVGDGGRKIEVHAGDAPPLTLEIAQLRGDDHSARIGDTGFVIPDATIGKLRSDRRKLAEADAAVE